MDKKSLYRSIPKVDMLLEEESVKAMIERFGREPVMDTIRKETEKLRQYISSCEDEVAARDECGMLLGRIEASVNQMFQPNMKMVFNGTGTVLHTNLGRSPIAPEHMERLMVVSTWYSNLEYDLELGGRGERYAHFEKLLCRLTGAEAAMAVNNNAAAVMLLLNSMAKGGEVIVSRGELVEIGGKFRIPDVMEQSGAVLKEVGTTNKTHVSDYEDGIGPETKALLKVHTSNYRIVGFTNTVSMEELVPLKDKYGIPLIEDLGSGMLIDLSKYGLTYEPTVQDALKHGADVVCFSGDKLLGGPQAGIIVGRKKYIDIMKKNQLTRALRIDKFTACILESILMEYLCEENAVKKIPTLNMITKPLSEITSDAEELAGLFKQAGIPAKIGLLACESQVGGGSMPLERLKSMAVTLKPEKIGIPELEERLRRMPMPLIARIADDTLVIDVRTIRKETFHLLVNHIKDLEIFETHCLF